jgi:hypothetical protein
VTTPQPDPLESFLVAQDGTLHFVVLAQNLDHAQAHVAALASCEAEAACDLGDGARLTHVTFGDPDDASITAATAPPAVPLRIPSAPARTTRSERRAR